MEVMRLLIGQGGERICGFSIMRFYDEHGRFPLVELKKISRHKHCSVEFVPSLQFTARCEAQAEATLSLHLYCMGWPMVLRPEVPGSRLY